MVQRILQAGLLGDQGIEIGVWVGEFLVDRIELVQHFDDGLHGFFNNLLDCFIRIELRFLLQQTDAVTGRKGHFAGITIIFASDDAQQGGFACPIQTQYTDFGTVIKPQRDIPDHLAVDREDPVDPHHGENYLLVTHKLLISSISLLIH